jgi:hypothetical protein
VEWGRPTRFLKRARKNSSGRYYRPWALARIWWRMVTGGSFSEPAARFLDSMITCSSVAESQRSAYPSCMANGLVPFATLYALHLLCTGCGADPGADSSSAAGTQAAGGAGGGAQGMAGKAAVSPNAGTDNGAPTAAAGATAAGGTTASPGSTGGPSAGQSGSPPPSVDGRSVYALECHGDSKDCNRATVPCFGVGTQTPNVAAGWACANRCVSNADCSNTPSGAEAKASCVPFTSASHCLLVCQNENQAFACPEGMICHVPPKSPLGYCLWQ